ncbi:unnamed protein product [Phyllotreta striolata]|uniref:Protein phosphatase inhibitor 2 n=1 Tax=Phyllotreta striolata TaxID=444603 RepID=A0A9N9XTD5_PHYSR|nr:unnamed protein product [Phyllotreta striolata]
MAENLNRRPKKSILKNSSSFDKQEAQLSIKKAKETKWDEMNIIATLHPPDKDYGHMKIQEPKTPFSYLDADQLDGVKPEELAERMAKALDKPPKALEQSDESEEEEDDLTEEEKQRRKDFEMKRKKHYNEYHALQMAKKLMEEEEDDEEDARDAGQSSSSKKE